MCGLVGIVGANLTALHAEAFKWMLHLDLVRGEDSTGVAFRKTATKNNRSQIVVAKVEGSPNNLFRKFPELFDARGILHSRAGERYDFLMGHNRSATIGVVNSANAHPFHHGNITGCHNGTISSGLLGLPTSSDIVGSTDSEKLFYALSKGWTIKRLMDQVTGAAALIWWDSSTKTFNLYRNKERPLFYTHNDANTVFAYASEQWILKAALGKAKLYELVKNIKEFTVDEHLQIKLGDNKVDEVKTEVVVPLVLKTTPMNTHITSANRNIVRFNDHKQPNWAKAKVVYPLKQEVKKADTPFRSDAGWLRSENISKEQFEEGSKYGCSMCQTDLEYDDHEEGFVKWMDLKTPFCYTCSKQFKTA
jgi:predicted glutamine amidotransferase